MRCYWESTQAGRRLTWISWRNCWYSIEYNLMCVRHTLNIISVLTFVFFSQVKSRAPAAGGSSCSSPMTVYSVPSSYVVGALAVLRGFLRCRCRFSLCWFRLVLLIGQPCAHLFVSNSPSRRRLLFAVIYTPIVVFSRFPSRHSCARQTLAELRPRA